MADVRYIGKTDLLYIINLIHTEVNKYQLKVTGKGLSTEDFTTVLKTKLEGIDLSQYSTTVEMNKAIADALKDFTGIDFVKVDKYSDLPKPGKKGIIYLVPQAGATGEDVFDEYFWSEDKTDYEKFGSTRVDLTGYLKKTDVEEIPATEIQAAWDSIFNPTT